jgi:hypothetical protein
MASLPVSCNRAISKKLWVMRALAFIRAAEVRKQRGNKTHKKKRDALARNDVHWAGQLCILIRVFSDYDRSHSRPCRGRFREMKSTTGISLSRFQT